MRALGPTIRSRLRLLVLVATLPLLVFSAILLVHAYHLAADLMEDTALSTARRVAASVDAQLTRAESVGYAFAELPVASLVEPADFEEAAIHVLDTAKLDGQVEVIDRDGNVVAHTLHVFGQKLGQAENVDAVRRVFETTSPQVTGVEIGDLSHQAQVGVHVPLLRDGIVRYDVSVMPAARSIGDTGADKLPDGWFTVIVDGAGRVVDDTLAGPGGAGEILSAPIAAEIGTHGFGFLTMPYRGVARALIGYTHTVRGDWTVLAGVSETIVQRPLLRSFGALAAGGGAVLLAGLALAWLIGRSIADPLGRLARHAATIDGPEPTHPNAWGGLSDIEAVARALTQTHEDLRIRERDREAALQRAEASEARLLLAQDVGEIGTWAVDLETGQREWSQGEFKLYGLDPAADAPDDAAWLHLVHPGERDAVQSAQARAMEAPMTYRMLFRIVQPSGAIRWLRSAGRSEFVAGNPTRLIGSTIDVTERQERERSLRHSAWQLEGKVEDQQRELDEREQRFRTYFEYSSDAMLIVRSQDGDFIYEMINKAAENLFGVTSEQAIGVHAEDVFPPETAFAEEALYRRAIEQSGEKVTVQRTLTFPAGSLHLETVLIAVPDPADPQIVRVISGSRDLTERQRLEGRLQHAQRLEAVGQLTGGVAHDFNNLLTVIIGNLSLLRRRIGDDERSTRYLTSVEAAAQRGAKLTASLLAFSRRQTLNVEHLDVAAQIGESTTLLKRALGEDIEFGFETEQDVPPANADAAQLEAAVLNLVINARDAIMDAVAKRSRRDGRLHVRVYRAQLETADLMGNDEARPGTFVAITVADNGTGMSQAVRNRAFEPFFTTKEIGHGTGLGLSQVFGFVRQLGGHVMIESTPDEGTEITLYLPAAIVTVAQRPVELPEPDKLPGGATILFVEDDDSIREITAEMLRDVGLRVLTAPNGPVALELLRGPERVDLLFSDVVMPGGATGVDLARAAHDLRPSLPVLLTSGYAGAALNRYGPVSEFVILAKPYTRAVLLERVGAMLAPQIAD